MALLKSRVGFRESLLAPIVKAHAPLCQTCGRYLDSEEVVETFGHFVRILGKHHGAEELATFDVGTRDWTEDSVKRAMRGYRWFDPTKVVK